MKRYQRRVQFLTIIIAGCLAVAHAACEGMTPLYYINVSASVPLGLYRLIPIESALERGDLVVFDPPRAIRAKAKNLKWLKPYPMLKFVGALGGDRLCRSKGFLKIYRQKDSLLLEIFDRRWLTWGPKHCVRLKPKEFFPIGAHARSYDGRYFGPVAVGEIRGKAAPVIIF